MKRLKLIIAAVTSFMLAAVVCYGAQPYFKDVSTASVYYQDIKYLKDNKIINGTGDGYFCPDAPMQYKDFIVMLNNYCGYGVNLYRYIVHGDVIEMLDINHLIEERYISKIDVLRQSCLALMLEPYSTKFYELPAGFEKFSALEQDEEDVILMCSQYGLIDLDEETYETMTSRISRGEAARLFCELIKLQKADIQFEKPKSAEDIIVLEYAKDITDRTMDVTILNDTADMPDWLIDSFHRKNMKIQVKRFSSEGQNSKISGLYNTRTGITVFYTHNYDTTIYHEFGHHLYYEYAVDINQGSDFDETEVKKLFHAEKEALVDYYRAYGGTDYREFFAEFFVIYMKAIDEGTTEELKKAMPQTHAYMDTLIRSNGGI